LSRDNFIKGGKSGRQTDSHIRAPKQEKEWATRLPEGECVPGSGSGSRKGDVTSRVFRLECKTTSKQSFSVTREMVEKIEEAALAHGQVPALIVEFNDGGKKVLEIAIVPTWVIENVE